MAGQPEYEMEIIIKASPDVGFHIAVQSRF